LVEEGLGILITLRYCQKNWFIAARVFDLLLWQTVIPVAPNLSLIQSLWFWYVSCTGENKTTCGTTQLLLNLVFVTVGDLMLSEEKEKQNVVRTLSLSVLSRSRTTTSMINNSNNNIMTRKLKIQPFHFRLMILPLNNIFHFIYHKLLFVVAV
jgi:hypothetical protein